MTEFVALRAKICSYLVNDSDTHAIKKAKVTEKIFDKKNTEV